MRRQTWCATAALAMVWPQVVLAQTERLADEVENSIVVTAPGFVPEGAMSASKTDAPLIEVPQSVSVVTRDQIDLLNFIDVQQAVRYTAGVVGENYGPDLRFDFLTVRGFTPVQYIDRLQAPVSATIANVGVDLYGFDHLVVLKGPSAVLYGTSPPGGIYDLASRRPDATFGGEVQVKAGTQDFKQVAGTLTGTLTDGVAARLTGLYRDRGSQTDFVEADRVYVAPAASVRLGPDTVLTGLGYYQHDRVDGDTNGFLPARGTLTRNPLGRVPRSINLGEPDLNFYEREQYAAGYELTHDLGSVRLTQNARWSDYNETMRTVFAAGLGEDDRTVSRFDFPFRDDVQQFAIDSRATGTLATGPISLRLVGGIDYRNYREASAFGFGVATPIDLFAPIYGGYTASAPDFIPFTDQRLKQVGVYGQDQARIGDVILTASGRQDWITLDDRNAGTRTKQDRFTYRLGASYQSALGLAPYISYATSFQPVVGQDSAGRAFEPSQGRQVEAGVKLDGRSLPGGVKLFAAAAAYHLRQSNVLTPDPTGGTVFQVQTGEVTVDGVELELVTRIRDALSVNVAYTYADARVTRSNVAGQRGAGQPFQPRHKASLFADYTLTAGPARGLGVGGGVRYLSDSPGGLPDAFNPVVIRTGESTLFDAVVRYATGDWRVAVNGTNLFDRRYVARCTGPVGCFFGPERQVIATVTRRF